uniref:EGF-like domain-containing protein n=1 Tax=Astyanax mexicanus TaxID=7994 RepID=A0A3B1K640_ASTMX
VGAHNCGLGFECINSAGSFICRPRLRCDAGFTFSRGQCVDIDECRTVTQPCSPGFNCVNTIGSYTCQRKIIMCGRGYHASPDGSRCIDVDECQTGVHRCGEGQLCHNLPGTYRCDCRSGYQYDTFRKMCVDVNECWRYPGRLCAQTCENTPGSYHCSCTSGFTLSSDGKNCEDVNECLNKPCSQECANVYGSFQCYCKQGYYLREDGLTCDDVDECSRSIGHLCAFKCVNVPGSYKCACPEHGYSMSPNGRSCRAEYWLYLVFSLLLISCKLPVKLLYHFRLLTSPKLPAELPDQHHHPRPDLPHRPLPRLHRRQHHPQHHQRERGRLLQHQKTQRLHRRHLPAPPGTAPPGLPHRRGDEAVEAGHLHHLHRQDLRLHHGQRPLMRPCLTPSGCQHGTHGRNSPIGLPI